MHKDQTSGSAVIFSGHPWEAQMVVNLLENEGIRAFINNEVIGTMFPFYTTPGMGAVRVIVSETDTEKAKAVVADFQKDRYK